MSTFQKQMALQRLSLPVEIIRNIKDYAFINIIDKTKRKKDYIMMLINSSIWVERCSSLLDFAEGTFIFCINAYMYNKRPALFGTRFCEKCGDYYNSKKENFRINSIVCNCNQLTFKFSKYKRTWVKIKLSE